MENKQLTTVEDKVRFIAERQFSEQGVNYFFMNWSQVNVIADKVTQPSIVYVLPASGDLNINARRQRIYDYPETMLAFLAPADFDFDGSENDDIIENMKRLAVSFITALNLSGMFEPIEGTLHYSVAYDMLDDNVTGIIIEPQLKETCGIMYCQECLDLADDCNLFEKLFGYTLVSDKER